TINMLTGLARPDAGTITVEGVDCAKNPRAVQHLFGVVGDSSNLYPELTGFDNLCFCAALFGVRKNEREARARELLDRFGLAEAAHRRFEGYSRGMKRRLTIAAGIIHRPKILFLDEPTTGLDVAGARQIRRLIALLHREGTTIFLTTHYIEEAERLCERIAFIVDGRIIRIDTLASLMRPIEGRNVVVFEVSRAGGELAEKLASAFDGLDFASDGEERVRVESAVPVPVGPLVRFIEGEGVTVLEARRQRLSLEDVFVEITGIGTDALRREKEGGGA
ncbi:MAG TPA: ABC transporter ATP-binding protein, partial [Candidatus Coatesbacteria bacterium]|nr:ABC transporter ATP-binding protein [Candidatus Coatesbacteria bacterium]